MASADFSQFVVTTADETVCETSRDKPVGLSSSTCLIYAYGLRLPFGLHCFVSAYPPQTPYYQVSVRQVTILLSLLLAHTSRCKPWESLWGSSATTPLADFHRRLTACPSYTKKDRGAIPCLFPAKMAVSDHYYSTVKATPSALQPIEIRWSYSSLSAVKWCAPLMALGL